MLTGEKREQVLHSVLNSTGFNSCVLVLFILAGVMLSVFPAFALLHSPECGLPLIESFSPEDYQALGQNTSIVKDRHGAILSANLRGVLAYNGGDWSIIEYREGGQVLSLATDEMGRVYAGYDRDIAVLYRDEYGAYQVFSLSEYLPDSLSHPTEVWSIFVTSHGVFFEGWWRLYRWVPTNESGTEGDMTIWSFSDEEPFATACTLNDELYVVRWYHGLMKLGEDDEFHLVPGTEFLGDLSVYEMTPFGSSSILFIAYNDDEEEVYYIFDGNRVYPFNVPVASYMREHQVYEVSQIRPNLHFIATSLGGMVLVDSLGQITCRLNEDFGLPDESGHAPLLDDEDALWVPLDFGLARIELNSQLSYFDRRLGIQGAVYRFVRLPEGLFAVTEFGLYRLVSSPAPGLTAHFERITEFRHVCYDMLEWRNQLIVATTEGIYQYNPRTHRTRRLSDEVSEFLCYSRDQDYIYYGWTFNGIGALHLQGNRWVDLDYVDEYDDEVREMFLDSDNRFWLAVGNERLDMIRFRTNEGEKPAIHEIIYFNGDRGLPVPDYFYPFEWMDHMYCGSSAGLYLLDNGQMVFHPSNDLVDGNGNPITEVFSPTLDQAGRLWFDTYDHSGMQARMTMAGVTVESPVIAAGFRRNYSFFSEGDSVVWLGGTGGRVLRYHSTLPAQTAGSFQTILASVSKETRRGSEFLPLHQHLFELDPGLANLRFEFYLPRYAERIRNQFQYRLIGLDDSWSSWSNQHFKEYPHLSPGHYRFEVRGRDASGIVGEPASFDFILPAPWYAGVPAIMLYVLLAVLLIILIIRLRIRQIEQKNQKLEALVEERTREAIEQLNRIQEVELEAEKLRTANKIAATISHEFNNPLAIIQGVADLLERELELQDRQKDMLEKVSRQVWRMHELVQKLLNLQQFHEVDYAMGMKILDIHSPLMKGFMLDEEKLETLRQEEYAKQKKQQKGEKQI